VNVRAALLSIKRCCLGGRIIFTEKAEDERLSDGLARDDVVEAVVNAPAVYKTLRSLSSRRKQQRETLYVIVGFTHDGILVYTKGALRRHAGEEYFYVFVSAKRSIED
jgi:hypothetical protein